MLEEKKKQKEDDFINNSAANASFGVIQTHGDAVKQHFVAYSGIDNQTGTQLSRSLKEVAKSKVNPEFEYQNIHQQAGFSAEIKSVARKNEENILKNKSERVIRTDDLGRVNDPLYDIVELKDGRIVEGSGSQLKFVGSSLNDPNREDDARRILNKIESSKYKKYLDENVKIEVPSDQYEKVLKQADDRINKLKQQLEHQQTAGKEELVQQIKDKIAQLEKIKKNLKKSTVSSDEAVYARLHPKLSTAKDIAQISHKAGIKTAEISSIIGGTVSITKNLVSLVKGEIEEQEALKNVAKDTASAVATGYATGFVGSTIKGCMQNSSTQYVRTLSKTNVPGIIVSVTCTVAKTMQRYCNGEIDGVECLESLGEEGTGMIASAMFAAVGHYAIPSFVIGSLVGGMLGYAVASATYRIIVGAWKQKKLARSERICVEAVCNEHIALMRQYRADLESLINTYLCESMDIFRSSFLSIKEALKIGDVDGVITKANEIRKKLGCNEVFSDMEQFHSMMINKDTFIL